MITGRDRRHEQIGLDRLIKFEWLERTAYLVLAGNKAPEVKSVLQEELAGAFRSSNVNVRGSLDKTITILLKTWASGSRDIQPLQKDGLDLLSRLERIEHVPIQWCMIMAVYPFWGNVATHTGRLLKLQGAAASSQIQRRVREQYGERETVSRRVRYVLRSFIDWGVLKETDEKGVYGKGKQYPVEDPRLIAWMIEATLYSTANGSAVTKDLLNSPCIFPFRLAHISAEHVASLSPRLSVLRHDLDDDLLMLR
jgi:hypothetical protein